MELRRARPADTSAVADIWYLGWQEAHLGRVPDALLEARTEVSFGTRASQRLSDTTVALVDGEVAGFVMVVDDEVEQVYVDPRHRGQGVADALMAHAEQQIAGAGHACAWLAVVAGNERARRFYARRGWSDHGLFDHQAPDEAGPIPVPAHRYVKTLTSP